MSEIWLIVIYLVGLFQGVIFGYLRWALDSNFRRGFVDGITLKFLRRS